jgi:hypothetical protein
MASLEKLQKFQAFVENAAREAMREMAPEYNLDASKLILRWDDRMGIDQWTYNVDGDIGTITYGMPAIHRDFKLTLRHSLDFLSKTPSRHSIKSLESIQTTESRNRRATDSYANAPDNKKMLRPSEYETHTFTSVMVVHKKSGQSVMVSGDGLLAHDLQTEAYVLLCKKVMGE